VVDPSHLVMVYDNMLVSTAVMVVGLVFCCVQFSLLRVYDWLLFPASQWEACLVSCVLCLVMVYDYMLVSTAVMVVCLCFAACNFPF